MQLIAVKLRQSGDRGAAGAVEGGLKGPLTGQGDLGGQMAQGRNGAFGTRIVAAQFDAHGALGKGWQPVRGCEQAMRALGKAKALQSGKGKKDGIEILILKAAQAGIHIAAQQLDFEVWSRPQDLGLAPHGCCTEPGTLGKLGKCAACRGDQRISGVLAFEHCAEAEPGGQIYRDVLHRMNGKIDPSGEQSLLQLLDEKTFATGLGEGAILDAITAGPDLDKLAGDTDGGEKPAYLFGLGHRQARATGAQAQDGVRIILRHDRLCSRGLGAFLAQGPRSLASLTVLGLETSCDETAAAVVRGALPGPGEILSNVVFSQIAEHAPFGGVVPEIAARAHVEAIDVVVAQALTEAGCRLSDIDVIAATAGPGLIGGVMVGLTTAKALALAAHKPLVAVNHLKAHALTARLTAGLHYPFLLLLISGGHCQLLGVETSDIFHLYGTTIDDAVGEAFDKTAKLLGLPYPGGPRLEQLARVGNPSRYRLPRPMRGRPGADFSFSGLKTAVRQIVREGDFAPGDEADLAAAFQAAVIASLCDRTRQAMARFREHFTPQHGPATLVAAGGVAANGAIRAALRELCAEDNFSLEVPPVKLCTDNGAMIAWAGLEQAASGRLDGLTVPPRARWPLAQTTT